MPWDDNDDDVTAIPMKDGRGGVRQRRWGGGGQRRRREGYHRRRMPAHRPPPAAAAAAARPPLPQVGKMKQSGRLFHGHVIGGGGRHGVRPAGGLPCCMYVRPPPPSCCPPSWRGCGPAGSGRTSVQRPCGSSPSPPSPPDLALPRLARPGPPNLAGHPPPPRFTPLLLSSPTLRRPPRAPPRGIRPPQRPPTLPPPPVSRHPRLTRTPPPLPPPPHVPSRPPLVRRSPPCGSEQRPAASGHERPRCRCRGGNHSGWTLRWAGAGAAPPGGRRRHRR